MQRFVLMIVVFSLFATAQAAPAAPPPLRSGFPRTDLTGPLAFGSPMAVDLDADGINEVVLGDGGACVRAWGADGTPRANFPLLTDPTCNGPARILAPLAAGDINGDGMPEIVAGTQGVGPLANQRGEVWAWSSTGSPITGWPKEMSWHEKASGVPAISSIALAQVQDSAALEIQYTTTNNARLGSVGVDIAPNVYTRRGDGSLIPVYPTWAATAGIEGALASGDITCDASADLLTGRDHGYLHAYDSSGRQPLGWPVRTYVDPSKTNPSLDPILAFPRSVPALGDLDGDGTLEFVAAGEIRAPSGLVTSSGLLVVRADGSRAPGWTLPLIAGAPLTTTLAPLQAVALGDLTSDGTPEIVINAPDGTIRAYSAAGQQLWSHDYAQGRVLFASEPILADVTGDGSVDVLFGVYSPDGSANAEVGLFGLNASGVPLADYPLALGAESGPLHGIRAAPTVADLDNNGTLELLAASIPGVVYAWDLGVGGAPEALPWPMARHDNWRTANLHGGPSSFIPAPRGPFVLFLPVIRKC